MKLIKSKKYKIQFILYFLIFLGLLNISFSADSFSYSKLSETLLNQDPDPVKPGEYVELRFKIEKEGNNEINDIVYELIPEYPFSFDLSDTPIKKLGSLIGTSKDKEYYTLYYKLKVDDNALKGDYELTLKQNSSSNDIQREFKFNIKVDEKKEPQILIGKVITNPNKLIADYDEAYIEVELVNVGDDIAEQVIAVLNLPNGLEESFGYSNRENLGSIEAGASKIAKFYFNTIEDITLLNLNSSIDLIYKKNSNNIEDKIVEENLDFQIKIFGRPQYEIKKVIVENISASSIDNELRIIIKNIGNKKSDITSVQIFKDSTQPFDFSEKSNFIGKLEVSEEATAIFAFDVKDDAKSKEYRLKLQIRSVVDGEVIVEDEYITINIIEKQKTSPADSITLRFSLYIIFLVIGFILGRKFKLKKKKTIQNN